MRRATTAALLVAIIALGGCAANQPSQNRIDVRLRMPLCAASGECVTIGVPEATVSVRLGDQEIASATTGLDGRASVTISASGPATVVASSPLLRDGHVTHDLLLSPTTALTTVELMGHGNVRP